MSASTDAKASCDAIVESVETVITGKRAVVEMALTVLLAEGHLLIEDVPGVGKTMLARALGQSIGCSVSRIQFTPDLLPSDITGVSVFSQSTSEFEFRPGPVFANLVIGDEINRASPKTQAALLECMAERQVTVDGVTYPLEAPFTVFATQNPIDMEGTYALPEAQRDRFMARISMGYPDEDSELRLVQDRTESSPLDAVTPVVSAEHLRALIATTRTVFASPAVERYAISIVRATREHPDLRLGASARASIHLLRAARSRAVLDGRDMVLPDDIKALAPAVICHRLVPRARASQQSNGSLDEISRIVDEILDEVPAPTSSARRGR